MCRVSPHARFVLLLCHPLHPTFSVSPFLLLELRWGSVEVLSGRRGSVHVRVYKLFLVGSV